MTLERWFAAACLTCLLLGAARADDDADAALRSELSQGLRKDLPSVSMAIATRRGVVWSGAVGYSDLETHTRADSAELYGIGSITKTFVACVIEQLVDEGRLSLEANGRELLGAEVLSGIPNADRATVRELLSHRSGVPSWELDREWIRRGRGAELEPDRIWGKAETLDYLRSGRDPATNEPGQGYAYSNTNYTLLGLIIEKVTGHDAVAEVHRRILDPLGLKDVHFEGFERIDAHRLPSRYHFGTAEFAHQAGMHPMFRRVSPLLIDVTRSNLSVEWTAGAMLATMTIWLSSCSRCVMGAWWGARPSRACKSFKPPTIAMRTWGRVLRAIDTAPRRSSATPETCSALVRLQAGCRATMS